MFKYCVAGAVASWGSAHAIEIIEGKHQTAKIPLSDSGRQEEATVEWWTALHEPLKALMEPFGQELTTYSKVLHGKVTLKNVEARNWDNELWLQLNLAFGTVKPYPLNLQLYFETKKSTLTTAENAWSCTEQQPRELTNQNSEYDPKFYNDCVIEHSKSSVVWQPLTDEQKANNEDPKYADFTAQFYIPLEGYTSDSTRLQDDDLKIGKTATVEFKYKMRKDNREDKGTFSMEILNSATKLGMLSASMLSAYVALAF